MKRQYFIYLLLCVVFISASNILYSQEDKTISYSTFNIRLDAKYDGKNNWKFRRDSVVSFISNQDLDIIGMQEVLPKPLKFLKKKLKKKYSYIGVGRVDGKNKGEHTPIFYNKERFSLVSNGDFWLSQEPNNAGSYGWDAACPRVVTWGKFQEKESGKTFVVVNTHFDHKGLQARKNSAYLIMDSIKSIAGDLPVILSGDFNVTDTSMAYNIITTHSYTMLDARKTSLQQTGNTYTFHDFGRREKKDRGIIDFIFVNKGFVPLSSYIPFETKEETGFLSDHNPVIVQLRFSTNK
ncbi:MAG: endonuclease/exonuclease/phosphatase family protein [Bacteroidales bacterium]|nr:endonuclease/exonuclease/phosphatase family protein [Bacteroidales bacterium]